MNSVVIILVTHIDELMYGIVLSISPSWVASMSLQQLPQSHQSSPQQPPSHPIPSPKSPQTIAGASSQHDKDDDNFADDDDADSLERETMPSETVEFKVRGAEVCEVESGAAVSIS